MKLSKHNVKTFVSKLSTHLKENNTPIAYNKLLTLTANSLGYKNYNTLLSDIDKTNYQKSTTFIDENKKTIYVVHGFTRSGKSHYLLNKKEELESNFEDVFYTSNDIGFTNINTFSLSNKKYNAIIIDDFSSLIYPAFKNYKNKVISFADIIIFLNKIFEHNCPIYISTWGNAEQAKYFCKEKDLGLSKLDSNIILNKAKAYDVKVLKECVR